MKLVLDLHGTILENIADVEYIGFFISFEKREKTMQLTRYEAPNMVVMRLLKHNQMIDAERQQFFWSRTRREGEHLIWTGSYSSRKYGFMYINGREKVYAHRVAYCLSEGLDLAEIEDLNILRTCDRNDCVARKHLVAKKKKLPGLK